MKNLSWAVIAILVLGFIFLYGPIVSLVIFSFNTSKLVTVWGGFSTHWYAQLLRDTEVLDAVSLSLRIGALSATLSCILGTMAGYILARFRIFTGRIIFGGMVTAPLVMPEVITGLSLLLLFVSMEDIVGWPRGRGFLTIAIAHITFTMSYVAVVMQSRFSSLDISLEEAAQDLGARPWKVFFVITLPIVFPAILSGWLLAFTISLDDLVITSFTSGPGSTTLPMVIFSRVRLGLNPEINAMATIIVMLVALGVMVSTLWLAYKEKQRQRDIHLAIQANQ
ncbi:MAG TPA: ABC transporter permease subunit [Dongiaceae bacterium]|nr:ABC transporter permease subunit [Dongiaceae bacterium]